MAKPICEPYDGLEAAEARAKELSKTGDDFYVIKAKVFDDNAQMFVWRYYVDQNGFIRNGEELICMYTNGKRETV